MAVVKTGSIYQEERLSKPRKHAKRRIAPVSPEDAIQVLQSALNLVGRAGLEPAAMNAAIGKMPVLGITIKSAWLCNKCYNFQVATAPEDLICGTCRTTTTSNGAGQVVGSK